MAHTCKIFNYRALGTIEQQIFTSSTPFSSATGFRYRTIVPYQSMICDYSTKSRTCSEKGSEDASSEKEMCSVCLEIFDRFDRCFMAPCRHYFHSSCILHWIHISTEFSCPVCRLDMYCPDRQAYYTEKTFKTILDFYDLVYCLDFYPLCKSMSLSSSVKCIKQ